MKLNHFILILILLQSCEFLGQEKIIKLPKEDQKLISKAMDDEDFYLKSIKKTDSSQNTNTISYYDNDLFLKSKEIQTYDENKKLDVVRYYNSDSNVKEVLPLFSETKYSYSDGYEKIVANVWRDGKNAGVDEVEKTFDERGKLLQKIFKSYYKKENRTSVVTQTFKYTIDKLKNTETICVEEHNEAMTPKSFESCTPYLFENGKTTNKIAGNEYVYDNKKRLIKELRIDKKGNPNFEDLYIYDDQKNTMEHQRYRFSGSKFLVAKDQTFYDTKGLIQKIIYFGMSENNTLQPEKVHLKFYDKHNKEKFRVELKSKIFVEKQASLP